MSVPPGSTADAPLRGRVIVLTRATGESEALRSSLEALGATVRELPAIAIAPPGDWGPADAALRGLPSYAWIAFTSRNSVRAVVERLPLLGLPPAVPRSVRVAAIGPSTAAELRAAGWPVDCLPAEASAAALGRAMLEAGAAGTSVLLPRGNLARPELQQLLEEAGARVDTAVVYRTVRPGTADTALLEQLASGGADLVVLASPSAYRNLIDLLGGTVPPVGFGCMGPTTAAAVRAAGLEPAVVAHEPTDSALIADIAAHFAEEHTHA